MTLAPGEDSLGCAASPSIDLLERPRPPPSGLSLLVDWSGPAPSSPLKGGGSMDGDAAHTKLSSPGARVTSAKSTWLGSCRDELKIFSELIASSGGLCDLADCRLWEHISAKKTNIYSETGIV